MGKIKLKKLNNQGSTFIMALLVITLLTTLALALANASLGNMMMKSIDRGSKNTFYTSESLLDEIRAGIGQDSVRKLGTAYESVLTEIVDNATGSLEVIDNNQANELLKERYIKNILDNVTGGYLNFENDTDDYVNSDTVLSSVEKTNMYTALNNYIAGYIQGYATNMATITSIGAVEAYRDFGTNHEWAVIVKDVAVSYKESNGSETYFSNITVDLEIEYPNMIVDFTNTNRLTDFTEYTLIADDDIIMTGQQVTVRDSVYAGNNIDIISSNDDGSNLVFQPLSLDKNINLICGGNTNGGTIKVGGNANGDVSSAYFQAVNIWCTNLVTTKKFGEGSTTDATAGAVIQIGDKCNTYVKDDLSVDAQKSEVTVRGKYYGYSYDGALNPLGHALSSAIIVNGRNSNVIIDTDELYIGGRAYIDIVNNTTAYDDTYQTGEALAMKGSQEVYLIPPEFLGKDLGTSVTNPMSDTTWDSIKNTPGVCVIPDDYFAKPYLDVIPYTVRETEGNMVYVYFNFKKTDAAGNPYSKAATDYIKAVASGVDADMYEKLVRYNRNLFGSTGVVDVRTDSSRIEADGLLVEMDRGNAGSVSGGAGWSPIKVTQTTENYENRYKIFTKVLASIPWYNGSDEVLVLDGTEADALRNYRGYEVNSSTFDSNKIIETIVDLSILNGENGEYNPEGHPMVYGASTDKYVKMAVKRENLTVDSDITGGVIICTGNVKLQSDFRGLIIAGGNIYIENNAMYTSVFSTSSNMIEEFILGKEEFRDAVPEDEMPQYAFKEYFHAYKTSSVDEESREGVKIENVNYKDLVKFDNWRKYED